MWVDKDLGGTEIFFFNLRMKVLPPPFFVTILKSKHLNPQPAIEILKPLLVNWGGLFVSGVLQL